LNKNVLINLNFISINFFLLTHSLGFGASSNNWVELGFLRFKLGFFFDLSIVSILGLFVSWYLLRYFK
tara:strand:+ start:64 stop:267 length:204 start_codon:yes stop_codon:yes gene_type:complete